MGCCLLRLDLQEYAKLYGHRVRECRKCRSRDPRAGVRGKSALPTPQSGCRAMTQMQQMERAMLEQSNRKKATFLAKTAVAIMAATMLVPLEPAALIPSDGGANNAIRPQQ